MGLKDYDNELLHLAHDLAVRLLPAFENTGTGIPYPRVRRTRLLWMLTVHAKAEGERYQRYGDPLSHSLSLSDSCLFARDLFSSLVWFPLSQVNLKNGVPPDSINETCTSGAGSLLVEFGILSRLIGDSTFEWVARRAVRALWSLRSNETGLLGQ